MDKARRSLWAWAFYDWANSAYATTVMAGFFPLFFKQYWSAGSEAVESTFFLGTANSIASLAIVLMAPLLGAIADRSGRRKRMLFSFAFLGVCMTAMMPFVEQGEWMLAAGLYVLATIGFSGSVVFYDALMLGIADESRWDRVSSIGFAMGYLGGGLLFVFNVLMVLNPEWFSLADSAEAVRLSFLTVAIWWALFSLPLFLWVDEPPVKGSPTLGWEGVKAGYRQLISTFHHIRRLREVFLFLLAYWFYIDGVDTVIRMAVDYGMSLGLDSNSLILALLITQFVGFPAAIGFGYLAYYIGAKAGIYLGVSVYLVVVVWAYFIQTERDFYLLAIAVGLVQGGVQALSRSLYARIIPPSQCAEFYGFYNMLGKFAAVLGPVLMGWVGLLSGSTRVSILSTAVLLIVGLILLSRVDVARGQAYARQWANNEVIEEDNGK